MCSAPPEPHKHTTRKRVAPSIVLAVPISPAFLVLGNKWRANEASAGVGRTDSVSHRSTGGAHEMCLRHYVFTSSFDRKKTFAALGAYIGSWLRQDGSGLPTTQVGPVYTDCW